ncbi:MAG TPA: flagellar motor protein MotB [Noviherbaspirillum sp.]
MADEETLAASPPPDAATPPPLWQKVVKWQDEVTRPGDGEEDTAWLVTYLDMMTILITLFVVMLAYSTFQPDKFTRLQDSLSEQIGNEARPAAKKAEDARLAPASQLAEQLAQRLLDAGLADAVKMEIEDRRLILQMQEKILFASGQAELNERGMQVLKRLAPTFMAPGQMISVEGHTDNVPISTGVFPSNWELSAARATRVVRYLAEHGVPPARLRAIGYGDTRPLAGNADEPGRMANRRVSIVIDLAIVGKTPGQVTDATGKPD